jgi:hypothetical protein
MPALPTLCVLPRRAPRLSTRSVCFDPECVDQSALCMVLCFPFLKATIGPGHPAPHARGLPSCGLPLVNSLIRGIATEYTRLEVRRRKEARFFQQKRSYNIASIWPQAPAHCSQGKHSLPLIGTRGPQDKTGGCSPVSPG